MSLTSTMEPGASQAAAYPASPIDRLFFAMFQLGASDLHLCVGSPALVRKDGRIQALDPNMPALTEDYLQRLLEPIMPRGQSRGVRGEPRYRLRLRMPTSPGSARTCLPIARGAAPCSASSRPKS